jgi:hypothetical protein
MRGRLCDETCLSHERLCPSVDVPHTSGEAADMGFAEVCGLRPPPTARVCREARNDKSTRVCREVTQPARRGNAAP